MTWFGPSDKLCGCCYCGTDICDCSIPNSYDVWLCVSIEYFYDQLEVWDLDTGACGGFFEQKIYTLYFEKNFSFKTVIRRLCQVAPGGSSVYFEATTEFPFFHFNNDSIRYIRYFMLDPPIEGYGQVRFFPKVQSLTPFLTDRFGVDIVLQGPTNMGFGNFEHICPSGELDILIHNAALSTETCDDRRTLTMAKIRWTLSNCPKGCTPPTIPTTTSSE